MKLHEFRIVSHQMIPTNRQFLFVSVFSSAAGILFGLFYQTLQVALEPAQVLAGIVSYPSQQNPMYLANSEPWTILHQFLVVFLKLGIDEITLCKALSGLIGMIFFLSQSLIVLAISKDYLIAILFPFFLLSCVGTGMGGLNYPILFLEGVDTYGAFGLSYGLLVIATMANSKYKLSGFLIGLYPAVHASMGFWFNLSTMIILLLIPRNRKTYLPSILPTLAIGYGITLISLAVHFPNLSTRSVQNGQEYFSAFIRYWDHHRTTFHYRTFPMLTVLLSIGICFWYYRNGKDYQTGGLPLALSVLFASGCVGILFSFSYWLGPEIAPTVILGLMPSRMLNLNIVFLLPFLVSLMAFYRESLLIQLSLLTMIAGLLFSRDSSLLFRWQVIGATTLLIYFGTKPNMRQSLQKTVGFLSLGLAFDAVIGRSFHPVLLGRYSEKRLLFIIVYLLLSVFLLAGRDWANRLIWKKLDGVTGTFLSIFSRQRIAFLFWLRKATIALFVIATITTSEIGYDEWKKHSTSLNYYNNSTFYKAAAAEKGLLLTSSDIGIMQLRTRRPVLLDGRALNAVLYVPETGYEVNRILQQIYGVDMLYPSEDIRKARIGTMLRTTGKDLWESRTTEDWREIKKTFAVTGVITYADWKLLLPIRAHHGDLILYGIP